MPSKRLPGHDRQRGRADVRATGGLLLLCIICVIAVFGACLLGPTSLSPEQVLAALLGHATGGDRIVVWEIRLPRAVAAMAVGVALGAAGAALQGLLRNPLAEPGVLGVSASAALGATLALYYGLVERHALALPLAAIGGALLATAGLTAAALRVGSAVTLILIGVGLSSFAAAVMSLLVNLAPNPFTLADMMNWMLGSVANRSFEDLALGLPFFALGMAALLSARRALTALTLGDEAAEGLGVDLRRLRLLVVVGAGLVTGAAVSVAGAIGFVGIVAPHLVRPLVDHDPARTLLPSALLAGLILVLADTAVRVAPTAVELNLGVVAALLGAPVFVWIAAARQARHG
jgi:iron complex transport system permease protein